MNRNLKSSTPWPWLFPFELLTIKTAVILFITSMNFSFMKHYVFLIGIMWGYRNKTHSLSEHETKGNTNVHLIFCTIFSIPTHITDFMKVSQYLVVQLKPSSPLLATVIMNNDTNTSWYFHNNNFLPELFIVFPRQWIKTPAMWFTNFVLS